MLATPALHWRQPDLLRAVADVPVPGQIVFVARHSNGSAKLIGERLAPELAIGFGLFRAGAVALILGF